MPLFRTASPGEQRELGVLERIDCGPRTPPDAVYLTWRAVASAPAGLDQVQGVAVAVEFLPK